LVKGTLETNIVVSTKKNKNRSSVQDNAKKINRNE